MPVPLPLLFSAGLAIGIGAAVYMNKDVIIDFIEVKIQERKAKIAARKAAAARIREGGGYYHHDVSGPHGIDKHRNASKGFDDDNEDAVTLKEFGLQNNDSMDEHDRYPSTTEYFTSGHSSSDGSEAVALNSTANDWRHHQAAIENHPDMGGPSGFRHRVHGVHGDTNEYTNDINDYPNNYHSSFEEEANRFHNYVHGLNMATAAAMAGDESEDSASSYDLASWTARRSNSFGSEMISEPSLVSETTTDDTASWERPSSVASGSDWDVLTPPEDSDVNTNDDEESEHDTRHRRLHTNLGHHFNQMR